jgi:predicted translin family RNA/ssDNA-binding protein
METKKVFELKERIDQDLIDNEKKREELDNLSREVMNHCAHELVFKYNDNYERKMIVYGNYYCPACGKIIRVFLKNQIEETAFRSSRVISLDRIYLSGTKEAIDAIRREVIDNVDLYYNPNNSSEELARRMESKLVNYQCDSKYTSRVLSRRKL